jgi:serine/threonine protein phosphatase 1
MSRIFVTTDTHGELEKLKDCLQQVNFNNEEDELIHIGDVVDRGPDSYGVVELLLSIKNLISIRGNHDEWMLTFINTNKHPAMGYFEATLRSYHKGSGPTLRIPETHKEFFRRQVNYHIDKDNNLFVHAGINPYEFLQEQYEDDFYWDRELIRRAMLLEDGEKLMDVNGFKQIFIGHTPTISFKYHPENDKPIYAGQVIDCDTGGCFGGKISLIDITTDNHILYQSKN